MYESPVNLIIQDIETQIVQNQEQTILSAIRKCGVVVDKDELIKAISYDRNQYSKGYKDGVNAVLDKIRAEVEKMPTDYCGGYIGLDKKEVLQIIEKYKAESEEENE